MQVLEGNEACRSALESANARRAFSNQPELDSQVSQICQRIRFGRDDELVAIERQFDCPTFELSQLRVTEREIENAWQSVPAEARRALSRAVANIEEFHRKQPIGEWQSTSPDGLTLGQRWTPLDRVGMYAPNFRAAYPSTVLMLAVPARVAGVRELALASPPSSDGSSPPMILAAAKAAGVTEIYRVGGVAAMAALAYGTQTIPAVDKLVGPGSVWVTLAKKYLYGSVGIDGLYGPSEVVVLADDTVDAGLAKQLAADLLAQAEHGADSFVCLLTTSLALGSAVADEMELGLKASSRGDVLRESLQDALLLCVPSLDDAIELCNLAAAEHVEIWSDNALEIMPRVRHAGAIFLNTPVPLGDYMAGPSHTLPTGMTSRFGHGVGVDTFLKRTSIISATPSAVASLADDLAVLADLEDLPGHAAAVRMRAQQVR